MKTKQNKLLGIVLVILTFQGLNLYGQGVRASLFDEVDKSMAMAKSAQAEVLSPRTFNKAMNEYNAAQKDYDAGEELSEIREKIANATDKFQEATENTEVSTVMFSSVLSARKDAINAEAQQFVKEMWVNAEDEMKEAAAQLEKGDADDAEERATEATTLYRKAELESIKANYLTSAKKLLQKADDNKVDKVAPKTMAEAKGLVKRAEKELLDNRYDTDDARHLAKEAEYKALLAMHIAEEEKSLDERDFQTEDYLLMSYQTLTRIGETLDMNPKFDQGADTLVSKITNRIVKDQLRMANLESSIYSERITNGNLKALLGEQQKIIQAMQGKLSDEALKGQKRQQALQSRIDKMAEVSSKFEQVQQIFDQEEALVFRQRNDVIIRMIGVNFDVGKSQIKQEDYALLTKVQEAMNLFEDASISIEGHTDSQGGDDANLKLSKERADAVLTYLNANTAIDKERSSTLGFGESKPIANNETAAGRKLNRHIDVVIKPKLPELLMRLPATNLGE